MPKISTFFEQQNIESDPKHRPTTPAMNVNAKVEKLTIFTVMAVTKYLVERRLSCLKRIKTNNWRKKN